MDRQQHKKRKEWNAIKKCIPSINESLHLNIQVYDDKYSQESPDFIFFNEGKTIGVEVVECHPSVRKRKRHNAPERVGFEAKVCNEFKKNQFLQSITKTEKLNILIDRKYPIKGKRRSVSEVCSELEIILKAWYQNKPISFERKYIRRIRVHKTLACNVVYFNNISRCDPIDWDEIRFCIETKNQKHKDYCNNVKCDEFWLCICLPFEETGI